MCEDLLYDPRVFDCGNDLHFAATLVASLSMFFSSQSRFPALLLTRSRLTSSSIQTVIIPLRIGSEGIPKKNLRNFCGRPPFYWVTKSPLDSSQFENIVIYTDSNEIEAQMELYFGELITIDRRPVPLGSDTDSTDSALCEFFQRRPSQTFALIQVTSPLLLGDHIKMAVKKFEQRTLRLFAFRMRIQKIFME